MKDELKRHFVLGAILLPLVLFARYTLFDDASEFRLFADLLERYVAPLIIVLSVALIAGLLAAIATKIDKERQRKLANTYFWVTAVVLALALVAVFAHVKLQSPRSVQSEKVYIL